MRRFVKCIAVMALFVVVVLVFRAPLYNCIVKYEDTGACVSYRITNNDLMKYIEYGISDKKPNDIHDVLDLSQQLTNKSLSFSLKAKENNPNLIFVVGKANCVGYAAFTASVANYIIAKTNIGGSWQAVARKGKLHVFGANVHGNIESRWFNDHDFVVLYDGKYDTEICVDPTVSDFAGINRVAKFRNE